VLKIYLNDENIITSEPIQAKGGSTEPFSYKEIENKFLWLTNKFISSKRQGTILSNVESFEKSNLTIRELIGLN
jgi:hypothetical protein